MTTERSTDDFCDKVTWVGFVNIDLTEAQKKQVKNSYIFTEERLFELIANLADDGYKVSVSWDFANNTYTASLTGICAGCANPGHTLTGRHSNLLVCLSVLFYKHFEVCEGGVWGQRGYVQGDFDW